ncbi:MAG: 6-bladed beta-propeller, partial [Alphaproteobacteria bacterium]|nr:6-bladed beta-propeller [Alphaproteobacteria bacterium]
SQDGRLLHTIRHASSESDCVSEPWGVSVSAEGLIYVCHTGNQRVTVHDEDGKFLFAFGSKGSGPGCFDYPGDIAFGSDGLVYVADVTNERVCVWSKEGNFRRHFPCKYKPFYIAATNDNHLLITSLTSHTVMVYTLEGELIHQFGAQGSDPGRLSSPYGIYVHNDSGLVYVADMGNSRIQVFS